MKYLVTILMLFTGFVIAPLAVADDLVVSRAVLEDLSGSLTIADVANREFTPIGPTLSRGFSDSAYWLRLHVQAPPTGSQVVLFIRQPFLNQIRLYEADAGDPNHWKTRVTGNHYAYHERDLVRNSLGFVVNMASHEATYYLRLKTASISQLSVEALEPAEAERKDDQLDLLEMFFVTSMLMLLLWAIHSYLLDRLPVVGLFAVHQAMYILFGIAITGYLAPYIPVGFPRLADLSTAIPYCVVSFTTLLFCRELFKPYLPPPKLMAGLNLFLLAFPLQLVALSLGYTAFAVILNAVLIKLMWWYFVIMACTLRKEQSPSRRVLQLFFVTISLIFTLFWFVDHSSSTATKSRLYGRQTLLANGLIIGGLFAMILNARARRLLQEAQQSAHELLLTQKTLEIERTLKEEAEAQARTDYLTGMFNRRHFIERAENETVRAFRYPRPLSLMMIDIDHFKKINDTWGHDMGDEVLRKVSYLIRNAVRDVDIVGRMGGEEFAIMLVETGLEQAMHVAQRLCATIAETTIVSQTGIRMQVTISLGVTGLHDRDINFAGLLKEADMALYGAKQSGRNRVVGSGSVLARQDGQMTGSPIVPPASPKNFV
ncbi:MAG: diguanylate cyclase [Desulfuromonadales bacterium]|nr:diguanylate cyclase [Desulfuromonadales bacterium]